MLTRTRELKSTLKQLGINTSVTTKDNGSSYGDAVARVKRELTESEKVALNAYKIIELKMLGETLTVIKGGSL